MDRQHGQAIVKSLSKGLGLDEVGYIRFLAGMTRTSIVIG